MRISSPFALALSGSVVVDITSPGPFGFHCHVRACLKSNFLSASMVTFIFAATETAARTTQTPTTAAFEDRLIASPWKFDCVSSGMFSALDGAVLVDERSQNLFEGALHVLIRQCAIGRLECQPHGEADGTVGYA